MKFGTTLGIIRQHAGFSQKRLASALNWDQSYLSRIESGKRKPPSRAMLLTVARIMNLSEEGTDELLMSAQYQPQSIFEMDVESNDFSVKKHIGILNDIRSRVPLSSYIRAKEEIVDFLELLRIKYLQKSNETLAKNTLLADFIYTKVKRGGLNALYEAVNKPQGGAVVIRDGKILLAQIGISPVKGIWHIPAGFVNSAKGDRSSKDIAIRLIKRYTGNSEIIVVRELTEEGGPLVGLDTTDYSIRLGFFPAPFQIFEATVKDEHVRLSDDAAFYAFADIPKIRGGIHPLLHEITKPFIKDSAIHQQIYKKGQETIEEIIRKKNYRQDMQQFYEKRIKKTVQRGI